MQQQPSVLVLSGGGSLGYAHMGVLSYLEDQGMLKDVHTFIGNSIGSILAFMCVMNMSVSRVWAIFEKFNMEDVLSCEFDISMLTNEWGIDDGELFEAFMVDIMTENGFSPSLTFGNMKKMTKLDLVVVATNSENMEAEYFRASTHPDVVVLDAVRASMSIPFLFTPKRIDGVLYFDGFLSDNFPLLYAQIHYPESHITGSLTQSFQPKKPSNFSDVCFNIIGKMMVGIRQIPLVTHHHPDQVLVIYTVLEHLTGLDWTLPLDLKQYAKNQGYLSAKAKYEN